MYVIVRSDLEKSQQTIQAIHAGIDGGKQFKPPNGHYLVVCTTENKQELHKAMTPLDISNIKYIEFIEPDINNEITAICSDIVYGDQRKVFKRLKLFK